MDLEAGGRLVSWQLGSLMGWALTRRRVRGAAQNLAVSPSLPPQQVEAFRRGSMETTSPRMRHSALSSEDGFVLDNGKKNVPGLTLPYKMVNVVSIEWIPS